MSAAPPASAPSPAWLRVAMPHPGYADGVVANLTRIAGTPCGRAMLEQVRASGHGVVIEKPAPTNPPNAHVRSQDPRAATAPGRSTGESDADGRPVTGTGGGADIVVAYDPNNWPSPIDRASPASDVMLFSLLCRGLGLLRGTADPTWQQSGEMSADEAAQVEQYRRERGNG